MKKRLERTCLPMNIAIFLRTPILKNIFKRQLLQWESWSNLGNLIKNHPLKYFLQPKLLQNISQHSKESNHDRVVFNWICRLWSWYFTAFSDDFYGNSFIFSQKNYFSEPILMNLQFQFHVKIYRSSHRRCSIEKKLLKISQNSQGNTCARVSFAGLQLY